MKLSADVELGNDAMKTAWQAAEAITKSLMLESADTIAPLREGDSGWIMDANGNTVGRWSVEP